MNVYRQAVIDKNTCKECKRLHGTVMKVAFSASMPLGAVDGYLSSITRIAMDSCSNDINGCRCRFMFGPSREGDGTMPDPNAPGPEEADTAMTAMSDEEKEKLRAGIEGLSEKEKTELANLQGAAEEEASSEDMDAPSLSDAKIDPELSAASTAILEGDVNEDEVGLVEAELDDDVGSASRDVSVTCFKCQRKTDTMVTRKQFDDQQAGDSEAQPEFRTKCKFCNHVTTYVLTEGGTHPLA